MGEELPPPPNCTCGHSKMSHTFMAPADERRVNVTITDVYAAPNDYGFLRINVGPETAVIDQNASNVTVTDVDPAPTDVDPELKAEPDPDEALAKAILHSLDFPPSSLLGEAVTAAVTDVLAARDDERAES